MKLLTSALLKRFKQVGSQENVKDPIVICKFFNPAGAGTWFMTEYNPTDRIFFGYASIFGDHNDEWGYTSLDELEAFQGKMGIGIERDRWFTECPASEMIVRYTKIDPSLK